MTTTQITKTVVSLIAADGIVILLLGMLNVI